MWQRQPDSYKYVGTVFDCQLKFDTDTESIVNLFKKYVFVYLFYCYLLYLCCFYLAVLH